MYHIRYKIKIKKVSFYTKKQAHGPKDHTPESIYGRETRCACPGVREASDFDIDVEQLVPGQSLLAQLGQEGIRVELLDIEDTGAAPEALGPHRGA